MTPNQEPVASSGDTPMTGTYIAVVIVEAVIIGLLFLLGRIYA
jgi:hypothetical protein